MLCHQCESSLTPDGTAEEQRLGPPLVPELMHELTPRVTFGGGEDPLALPRVDRCYAGFEDTVPELLRRVVQICSPEFERLIARPEVGHQRRKRLGLEL